MFESSLGCLVLNAFLIKSSGIVFGKVSYLLISLINSSFSISLGTSKICIFGQNLLTRSASNFSDFKASLLGKFRIDSHLDPIRIALLRNGVILSTFMLSSFGDFEVKIFRVFPAVLMFFRDA